MLSQTQPYPLGAPCQAERRSQQTFPAYPDDFQALGCCLPGAQKGFVEEGALMLRVED